MENMQFQGSSSVIKSLSGQECQWCSAGSLSSTTFKGTEAVVCDRCGTPAARFW
ncbi:HVO_A0556 family zinc finger protein [Haladaptatus sp. CMSO5]|uniref:HVO_A0556 family zinc finger protein n=1 Tax=Haladaptatus sp. CMSO5 TaxID=3120514 RepID=UPI002FCDEA65